MPYIYEHNKQPPASRRSSGIPRPMNAYGISHASKPSTDVIPNTPAKKLQLLSSNTNNQRQQFSSREPRLTTTATATTKSNNKCKLEVDFELPVLELIPFGQQPNVDFGRCLLAETHIRYVVIRNLEDYHQELFVKSFPKLDKGFNIDATEFLLAPRTEITVAISWTPKALGPIRETITLQDSKRPPRRIVINGVAIRPKSAEVPKTLNLRFMKRNLVNTRFSPSRLAPRIKQISPQKQIGPRSSIVKRNPEQLNNKPLTKLMAGPLRRQSAQFVKNWLSKYDDAKAVKVQSYCRMVLSRRQLARLKERLEVVIKLQSYARMTLAKREFLSLGKKHFAATVIQTNWRAVVVRRSFLDLRKSIIMLQSHWRRVVAKRQLDELRARRDAVILEAVIKLQSYARMLMAKRRFSNLKRRHEAALRIQTNWRAATAKRKFLDLKNNIILLQSHWRRLAAQRQLVDLRAQRDAVIVIQSYMRMILAERNLHSTRKLIAFQSYCRTMLAKRQLVHLKERFEATVKLQSHARMILARRQFLDLKRRHNAALMVQTNWRSTIARRKFVVLRKSIILLQSHWRKIVARRQLDELRAQRDAAIVIQSYARMFLAKRKLRNLKRLVALQSSIRGFVFRSHLRRSIDAITRIQERAMLGRRPQRQHAVAML